MIILSFAVQLLSHLVLNVTVFFPILYVTGLLSLIAERPKASVWCLKVREDKVKCYLIVRLYRVFS